MSVAAEAAPRGVLDATRRPKALAVSTATVDYLPRLHPGHTPLEFARELGLNLPDDIRNTKVGEKVTVDSSTFYRLVNEMRERQVFGNDVVFDRAVGGNAVNVGHRLAALRRPDDGLVVVHTWAANDPNGDLVRHDLQRDGLQADLIPISGETPAGLVIPRVGEDGKLDRTIFSLKPANMPSDFSTWLGTNPNPDFAVINSLTGPQWPDSLSQGTGDLKRRGIRYSYTPGSSQFKTIEQGQDTHAIDAVYDTVSGASLLAVDKDELFTLLRGRGIKPVDEPYAFMNQSRELGAENVMVTLGADGLMGTNQEGLLLWSEPTKVKEVVDKTGAGDGALAGGVEEIVMAGDLRRGVELASVSASFAVQEQGAHTAPPTKEVLYERHQTRRPRTYTFH